MEDIRSSQVNSLKKGEVNRLGLRIGFLIGLFFLVARAMASEAIGNACFNGGPGVVLLYIICVS